MIFNETQILKDAIEYLDEQLTDVYVAPESQDTEAVFPCVLVALKSSPTVVGINETLLNEVVVQVTIFADNVYDTTETVPPAEEGQEPAEDAVTFTKKGVMSILDECNAAMEAKHYRRQNATKPAFHQMSGRWYKNIWYSKKSNTF